MMDMVGIIVGIIVGCYIGMTIMAVFSVNSYNKGFEDGKAWEHFEN
jgi:formate-dependent nitrite reductase membrane component NrfD